MKRFYTLMFVAMLGVALVTSTVVAQRGGRGGGGRGGGGGGGGGRGGYSGGGGGGGRSYSGGGRSYSGGGASRSGSASRPPSRPTSQPSRPSTTNRPASRPGNVSNQRPGGGYRPSTGSTRPGNRPATGAGNRPQIGERPAAGQLPANRSGLSGAAKFAGGAAAGAAAANLPGLGNRPDRARDAAGERSERVANRRDNRPEARQERRDSLQDRLASRNDRAEDRVNSREDRRTDRREDWNDWYNDHHGDWHHGNWHGNAGEWWDHMWSEHTAFMAFRTTMWGLNRISYGFGLGGYENPYYDSGYSESAGANYDYSEPMMAEAPVEPAASTVPTDPAAAPAAEPEIPGMAEFDQARDAFYQGNYTQASKLTTQALSKAPKDAAIHEFRALILFAQGKYKEAAATLNSVLEVTPGWDWTTMSGLYSEIETYTTQLRKLEKYVESNPKEPAARFVLAYHYVTCGHNDEAAKELKIVVEQQPKDQVAAQLLVLVAGPDALPKRKPRNMPPAAGTEEVKIDTENLVGKWTAKTEGSKNFQLVLAKDGEFTWTFNSGSKQESVKGIYAVDGSMLAMEPESGGTMLAQITDPKDGSFSFKMMGGVEGQSNLTFRR